MCQTCIDNSFINQFEQFTAFGGNLNILIHFEVILNNYESVSVWVNHFEPFWLSPKTPGHCLYQYAAGRFEPMTLEVYGRYLAISVNIWQY